MLSKSYAPHSALTSADEEGTVGVLKGHQAAVLPFVAEHGVRIMDTAGDGTVAERCPGRPGA